MGLPFDEPAEDPAAAALAAARKELAGAHEASAARQERLEALAAASRRIKDEFMAVNDRIRTMFLAVSTRMSRLVDDPSGGHSGLDEHLRDCQEATAQLRTLAGAVVAVDRDLAACEYEERLARGRVAAAGAVVDLAGVMEAFDKLKLAASAMAAAAAATDASSGGVEGATTMDQD